MNADHPTLLFWFAAERCYVCPGGRATQRTCPTAELAVSEFLAAAPATPVVVVDLAGCEWVDSTFAGWLVGLRKRLARISGTITIGGCSPRCRQSLERMHVAGLFNFQTVDRPAEVREIRCHTGDRLGRDDLQLMLRAHEELAEADASNARTFGPVVDVIRRQIDASSPS